jgi:hypothetical protein
MFGALVFLGLAADVESGAENTSDAGLIITFFLAFFGSIVVSSCSRIGIVGKPAKIRILY